MEISGRKNTMREITGRINVQEANTGETVLRSQRRCMSCGNLGHYQKKCPNRRNVREEN